MMTLVELMLMKYTVSNGRDASVGSSSLWRHLRSRTSSENPKNTIQHIDSRAAR
uniref:Uncharacterized protein n=1 Tax=Arion vulgaris TaxID=1028688 RepID=A0A0B7AJB4_9EUPU